jgi:hypothetical protein
MDEDNTFIRMDMRANITPKDLAALKRQVKELTAERDAVKAERDGYWQGLCEARGEIAAITRAPGIYEVQAENARLREVGDKVNTLLFNLSFYNQVNDILTDAQKAAYQAIWNELSAALKVTP